MLAGLLALNTAVSTVEEIADHLVEAVRANFIASRAHGEIVDTASVKGPEASAEGPKQIRAAFKPERSLG